jgi:prepilin-type N-terminal cleavage/methylation domain-containing protein
MTRTRTRPRRGFTLIEVMIALAIAGIIGAALTSLIVSQTRFSDLQRSQRNARKVSRSGLNVMMSELRMVERLGVVDASPTRLTVRTPFAVALFCSSVPLASSTVLVLPTDSVALAQGRAGFSGFATRDPNTNAYTYTEPAVPATISNPLLGNAACDGAGIGTNPVPGGLPGRISVQLTPAVPATAVPGDAVMLYQTIRYEFRPSVAVPGTVGLWRRQMRTGVEEELVAPFANSAGFQYFAGTTRAPGAAPADLTTIVGVSLRLNGLSERRVPGRTARDSSDLTTAIYFKNR